MSTRPAPSSILVLTGLLTVLIAAPLGAQPVVATNAFPSVERAAFPVDGFLQDAARADRNAAAAVLLAIAPCAFGVCGLGSFYAGNAGHGLRHLAIGVASIGVAVGAIANCDLWGPDGCETEAIVFLAAGAGYLGNLVWSAFVARDDVRAYNAAGGG